MSTNKQQTGNNLGYLVNILSSKNFLETKPAQLLDGTQLLTKQHEIKFRLHTKLELLPKNMGKVTKWFADFFKELEMKKSKDRNELLTN
ncbi:MAG: hypothetical protein LW817_04350, partial [Candidatus Caenarcaniphilales bacterium]|nr:hypothetical protein [Candidatus Caenarcaniphilales bacterium]